MFETTRPFLARHAAGVSVDAELQPFSVDVVGEALDAIGKTLWIGNDRSISFAPHLPAVVNVHVLVARSLHATADHYIRNLANEFFTYVTAKLVPAIPTHHRSLSEQGRGRNCCLLCRR